MKWHKYDIRNLTPFEYAKWYALMSKDKQYRVDRFRYEDDKKRTVAGEMLARKAVAEWCDVSAESIVFDNTGTGKPYAKDLPVEFNISHSGDMVVCAVDERPIGIDIEKIRPIDLTVAKHICTDDELIYLFGYTPTEKDFTYTTDQELLTRFFELWTTKEAICKLRGIGIGELCSATDKYAVQIKHIVDREYIICIAMDM